MRSRGLKTRLISIAVGAGVCIAATLLLLEYYGYRQSSATIGVQGER